MAQERGPLYHLHGIVGQDPKTRQTRSGSVVGFSLGLSSSYDRETDQTTWYDVTVFNEGLQQSVLAEVYKGARVAVEGYYSTREYNGKTYHQLTASRVGLVEFLQRSANPAYANRQAAPAQPAAAPAPAAPAQPAAPAADDDDLPF